MWKYPPSVLISITLKSTKNFETYVSSEVAILKHDLESPFLPKIVVGEVMNFWEIMVTLKSFLKVPVVFIHISSE